MSLTIYTSTESLEEVTNYFKKNNITVTDFCPENGKSPWEQIEYIRDNCDKSITIFTYSPYIINMLNLLIRQEKLDTSDLEVLEICEDEAVFDLILHLEDRRILIDARSLSDPISWIYQEYNELNNK